LRLYAFAALLRCALSACMSLLYLCIGSGFAASRAESGKAANQLPRGRSRKQLLGDAKTFCETEKR